MKFLQIGETVESPEFELCQRTWQLRIFPGGSLPAHKNFLSFYLASKSTVVTRASYKLIIVRQAENTQGEQPLTGSRVRGDELFQSTGIRKFEARGVHVDGWGRDKFIAISTLKDSQNCLLVENRVIFKTEITVYGELEIPMYPKIGSQLDVNYSLKHDIAAILFDRSTADISLTVIEESDQSSGAQSVTKEIIYAHRTVLCARSPVFHAMLRERENSISSMAEVEKRDIAIVDFDTETIRHLLIYMYTEDCK